MSRFAVPLLAVFLLGTAGLLRADDPPTTGQPAAARAGRMVPPQSEGPDTDLGTHPWSPDVLHSNVYPYKKPIQVPTNFCGPPGSFWLNAEFLLWTIKGEHLPPLLNVGPSGSGAVAGAPGVQTAVGGNTANPGPFYGGRFTAGVWIDNDYTWAFEGSYFFIADQSVEAQTASAGQPGSPDLGRPFFNPLTGQAAASPIASAGRAAGTFTMLAPTEFQGAEGNFIWNLHRNPVWSLDVLAGFRYQDLGGDLTIASNTTALAGPNAGTRTILFDQLSAHNHFYGGQVGARANYRWRQLVLGLTEKIALGGNMAAINTVGYNTQASPAGTVTQSAGGLLTQPSNLGSHSHSTFAAVNELDLKVGWQICDYLQMYAGYTLIAASAVVRPTDLVDLGVNPTQTLGGPARPAIVAHDSTFWAQGLTIGMEIRY